MILKCKMCGGDLHPEDNAATCVCEFCGTTQTVPQVDNEKKTNLFNRANRLRMNAEFDRAASVYASVTAEFPEEAEAYWGLCLCKYGIEYVDDPATGNKIPTCHRTLSVSIMDDEDFIQACENADPIAKKVYREEAKAIDRLQQDILSIVANESPYDVFICYKETDDTGSRTEDSVLAQEIYDALTSKGLKVFFSRITLEDKLGQQYEPYIYAALHSAKVMLAVGTQFEYYDAVWVKNEWARFLDMMRSDKGKYLIPCYKDIDAYDMPREFKNLQAQDMGKLGWLQDLTRGVMKLCGIGNDAAIQQSVVQQAVSSGSPTVLSLLDRTRIFLEDKEWEEAERYADKVLDIEPRNAHAYLYKLMAERHACAENDLAKGTVPFLDNLNAQRALRFADEAFKNTIQSWNQSIVDKINEKNNKEKTVEDDKQRIQAETKAKAEVLIAEYDKAIHDPDNVFISGRYKQLISQRSDAQHRLDDLQGVFSGKQRKLIIEEINGLNEQIASLKPKLDSAAEMKKEYAYRIGRVYLDGGLYTNAAQYLHLIQGFRDVRNLIKNDSNLAAAVAAAVALEAKSSVGKYVTFGSYPQTKAGTDSTPVEWLVLAREGEKALLLSRYALECKPYNTSYESVTWETCTLRKWLNDDFINKTFTASEQTRIVTVTLEAQGAGWSAAGGNNTQDKVFLLSYAESEKYFMSDDVRRCAPTDYAAAQGGYDSSSYKADGRPTRWWWLRSPGTTSFDAANVYYSGALGGDRNVSYTDGVVRPALWLDLGSSIF